MPSVSDVYVDPALTDVSVKYSNSDYLADRLFPRVNVKKRTGIYWKYDKANLTPSDSLRVSGSRANRVDHGLSKQTYGPLLEHSLEEGIDYDVRDEAMDPLDPKVDATQNVSEKLLIEQEIAIATILADTAQITQYTSLSGGSRWDDYANSSPFTDIRTGITTVQKNALVAPNTMWMSIDVWAALQNHPDFLERIKYNALGVMTTETMMSLFPGITNIMIGNAMYNTAAEGQTASMSPIWGKHFWVGYVTPQPKIRAVSLGYTLTLENGRYVDSWDEPQVKQEFVRVNDYYSHQIVAAEAAYAVRTVVS